MERTEVLDMMSGLKLYGMRGAYDETLATALKRKHEPQRFVGGLLKAEISGETSARSIKYQLTVAKLPLAKDVVKTSPSRIRRSMRLSCAIWPAADSSPNSATSSSSAGPAQARRIWPSPSRGAASALDRARRFFTTVDLVNQLEAEGRAGRQGRIADYLTRLDDVVILDELGYLPLRPSRRPIAIPSSSAGSTNAPRSSSPPISPSANGRACSATQR